VTADLPAEPVKMYNDDIQVVQEITVHFDRASKSAAESCARCLRLGRCLTTTTHQD
jgi:hypothetical protein